MIHIAIPVKNKSSRMPHKDIALLPCTLGWLQSETVHRADYDDIQIVTYGYLDDEAKADLGRIREAYPNFQHIDLTKEEDSGHLAATEACFKHLNVSENDKLIMLQPTQPQRRYGLLADCLDAIGDKSVISATSVRVDNRLIS